MELTLKDLFKTNRTCRRFDQGHALSDDTLKELVDMARLTPSAGNLQPLKYILSADPEKNIKIFSHLRWAAYLKEWAGPGEGERPAGYILILGDSTISAAVKWDHSIAALAITLGAADKGLAGCIFGSFDQKGLRETLEIPDRYEILLVTALGRPVEKVVIEEMGRDGDVRYWRDDEEVHHVPKRTLDDIILDL